MNQEITPLSHVDPMMDDVKVLVRCISKWFNHPQGKPEHKWSMEMVLQDQLGNRIQATVLKECLKKFEPIIDEGSCYKIANFGVAENGGNFPLMNTKYRINFYMNTIVTRVNKFDNNVHGFRFEPFQNFHTKSFALNDFVDVIGTVVSISDLIPFSGPYGKEQMRRTILLQDVDGLQIECCFFDAWAERFNILAQHKDSVGHVVLILKLARVKTFNGKKSISNDFVATKMYNNTDIPEVAIFKKRYQEVDGYDEKMHTISLFSPSKKEVTPEMFFGGAVMKMVGSIRDSYEKQEILVYAKIHKIHREFGWTFLACKQCGRSAKESTDDGSSSSKSVARNKKTEKKWACKFHPSSAVTPKYKVIVRVIDESGSASFLLYEDMIMKFIDVPCYKMVDKYRDTVGTYPDELKVVVGKHLLFRIIYSDWNIKHNNHVYQVKFLTEDPTMIETFKKDFFVEVENQETENDDEFETPDTNADSFCKLSYADVIPFNIEETPISANDKITGDGRSRSNTMSGSDSGSSGKHDRDVIDLDNYEVDESASKKKKHPLVEVKLEKDDE